MFYEGFYALDRKGTPNGLPPMLKRNSLGLLPEPSILVSGANWARQAQGSFQEKEEEKGKEEHEK